MWYNPWLDLSQEGQCSMEVTNIEFSMAYELAKHRLVIPSIGTHYNQRVLLRPKGNNSPCLLRHTELCKGPLWTEVLGEDTCHNTSTFAVSTLQDNILTIYCLWLPLQILEYDTCGEDVPTNFQILPFEHNNKQEHTRLFINLETVR